MTRLARFHPGAGAALTHRPNGTSQVARLDSDPLGHLSGGTDDLTVFSRLDNRLADTDAQNRRQSVLRICLEDIPNIAHARGDTIIMHLLEQVSDRLRLAVKDIAEVDHASAMEFVVIPQVAEASRLETSTFLLTFANELLDILRAPVHLGNRSDRIAASIGIAVATCNSTAQSLYEEAGIAARCCAAENGNRVKLFLPGMRAAADTTGKLDAELRTALAEGQLALYAQPQVDMRDRTVVGHETLVRWNHPERGLLPPSEFICHAEKTGLIRKIDTWMIEQACSLLGRWACTAETAAWRLSVNVSRAHLCDHDFVDKVAAIIENSEAPVARLTLEITETMVFDDFDAALRNMTRLRHMGLLLSLDDFGTGFSSINMIRQLPFTEIKIDQAFVADLPDNLRASKIVANIISLAQVLGLNVIAEGVETAAQETWLLENGCHLAQGYLFGRPEAMKVWP